MGTQSGTPTSSPPREQPLQEDDGIAVLRGNLAPRGAIVKPAAASHELLVHRDQQ
jgi:dihydroxyacid dehydratase/phosphogluconate dehydratase